MKELIRNNNLYIKRLYEEGTILLQKTRFVLIANRIPPMSTFDRTIWNTMKAMLFVSIFVHKIEPSHDSFTTYLNDINFLKKILLLASTLMRLVIIEYKQHLTYSLEEPTKVKDYSEMICISNDIFR